MDTATTTINNVTQHFATTPYTVKIRWQRFLLVQASTETGTREIESLIDEHDIFVPADRVETHGVPGESPSMDAWEPGQYENYVSQIGSEGMSPMSKPNRLIGVWKDGVESFFLVSNAWLLNERGDTIQRLVP